MLSIANERYLTKILSIGAALTTLTVVTGSITDPVNAPKLLVLGIIAISTTAVLATKSFGQFYSGKRLLFSAVATFLFSAFLASALSQSPISQNIYGVYGRNTGLLAYVFLSLILLISSSLTSKQNITTVVYALAFAGICNVVYSTWVVLFGDPIGWNNPYGALLGTFGNPNFISSFLGITFSICLSLAANSKFSLTKRTAMTLISVVSMLLMPQTNSVQGYVVAITGASAILFLKLRSLKKRIYSWIFLTFIGLSAFISVLGVFQKGPLSTLLYQGTISFRGQYWKAAINMGLANPVSGVGMDSYGDNYRLFREAKALVSPGVQVITNSAHNVILELFASGGVLLVTSYLVILLISLTSIFRVVKRSIEFDFVFAAVLSAWLGYQLQSIISINQLGLAIWGWILMGLVIAYDIQQAKSSNQDKVTHNLKQKILKNNREYVGVKLTAFIGGLAGLILALPPVYADYEWVKSTNSKNVNLVVESLTGTYFKPTNVNRMVNAVALMEQSQLFDYSYDLAKRVVEFNPNSFDAWRVLYFVRNASTQDKAVALSNMKRLDPLNPDVTQQ